MSSRHDPAVVMGEMFLSPSTSKNSTDDFVDILPCRFDEVTLPMLGAAFFERGWLAPRSLHIRPSDTVALEDIGYWTDAGEFIVVDNVHHSLQAESGILSWNTNLRLYSGDKLEDTSADIIVSRSGKSYQRRRHVHFQVSFDLINQITLDFSLSLFPPTSTCICKCPMKISIGCMHGGCYSTTRTRSSRSMASLLPRMS